MSGFRKFILRGNVVDLAIEEKVDLVAVAGDQASADLDELIAALLAEELVEAVDLAAGED